jgi:uncharacterized protein
VVEGGEERSRVLTMLGSGRRWLTYTGRFAVAVAAIALAGCGRSTAAGAPPPVLVRFSTGPHGGGFYPLGEGLARAYAASLPNLTVQTVSSGGAVANAEAIQRGEADLGFAFADVAYIAFGSGLNGASRPYDRLRGIAVLQLTPLHLVVRPGSDIRSIAGLRGRRVSVGLPSTGTALTVRLVLDEFGLGPREIDMKRMSFNEAAHRLVDGTLDAMFDTAIYPADSVQLALDAGARLVPITGRSVERLRHEYPFFRPALIPQHTYSGVGQPIPTIGVDSLLVCRRDLDAAVVYDLTRGFFEALPALASSVDALRFMDLDQSPATPIPLHAGAARFYRERELLR